MKKRHIVFITNGLGNSLFQLSFVEYLEQLNLTPVYPNYFLAKKNFLSNFFNFLNKFHLFSEWNFSKDPLNNDLFISKLDFFSFLALSIIFIKSRFNKKKLINSGFQYEIFKNHYYYGYRQSPDDYLSSKLMRNVCKKYISFGGELVNLISTSTQECVIHIRHGDFSNSENNILELDFYKNSMYRISKFAKNMFFKRITIIGIAEKIFVEKLISFLQELGYKPKNILDLTNLTSIKEDFMKIWFSKYLINSNSTFSYWASWGTPKYIITPLETKKLYNSVKDAYLFHEKIIYL